SQIYPHSASLPAQTTSCRSDPPMQGVTVKVLDVTWGNSRRSVENRVPVPGPLQLEESVGAGDQQHAIPQPAARLAARNRRNHRAEDGRSVDRDDGGAHVVADPLDPVLVRRAQRVVILAGIRRRRQVGWQAGLGERRLVGGALARRLVL